MNRCLSYYEYLRLLEVMLDRSFEILTDSLLANKPPPEGLEKMVERMVIIFEEMHSRLVPADEEMSEFPQPILN